MFLIGVHPPWSQHRPYEDREARVLQSLFPHLKRALQIQNRLDQATAERDTLREVADRLQPGMIVYDARGRIQWANQAAEALCRQTDDLTITNGMPTAVAIDENSRLAHLLRETLDTANDTGLGAGDTMLVSRPSGRRGHPLLVSPLHAGRRQDEQRPAAVVFISDPEDTPELSDAFPGAYVRPDSRGRATHHVAPARLVRERRSRPPPPKPPHHPHPAQTDLSEDRHQTPSGVHQAPTHPPGAACP